MEFQINARNQTFSVNLPDSLVDRACEYALGVIAQRETAGMGEKDKKHDGSPYTEEDRLEAIRARFARIEAGDWATGGGRAADPIMRELAALCRLAGVRKRAKTPYEVKDVPASSNGDALLTFVAERFSSKNAKLLATKATAIAAEKADPLA